MTVDEAATRLEVTAATVYALCRAGRIGHHRIGLKRGVIRIDEEDLVAYKASSRVEAIGAHEGALEAPRAPGRNGRPLFSDAFSRRIREAEEREEARLRAREAARRAKEAQTSRRPAGTSESPFNALDAMRAERKAARARARATR